MADPITMGFMIAGTAMQAGATIAQGELSAEMGKIQATQLRQQALADQAESQVIARQERKKSALMSSRVKALTASSGTGLESPNVVQVLADIDQRGEYNALAALYTGETSARSKRLAANMAIAQGKNQRTQSRLSGLGTIMTSGATMSELYG